jgi:hypothetical protein
LKLRFEQPVELVVDGRIHNRDAGRHSGPGETEQVSINNVERNVAASDIRLNFITLLADRVPYTKHPPELMAMAMSQELWRRVFLYQQKQLVTIQISQVRGTDEPDSPRG